MQTVQVINRYRPWSLVFLSFVMISVLTPCDRQRADQSMMSVIRADETVRKGSRPMWVLDPSDPGPDLPPAGRSLFDFVVTEQQGDRMVYKVPFPFTALVRKIEKELEPYEQGSPLKRVLIPLNRSLQRHIAKPDYFTYPRAVLGVDSEPPLWPGFSGMFLKDRLFLGYQEKADILEVISYNEAAGRFEFQVVRDYGPGKKPKVLYANRTLCTTCHQNQSPIFSRPLWDESNANQNIAALLQQHHAELYGFPVRQGIDVPNAIDEATDRANEFSTFQLVWQEGCESAHAPSDSIQCRAALFRFLLQSRLNGSPSGLRLPPYRDEFVPRLAMQWQEKWPQGLQVPNPDLPNRNPLDYPHTISRGSDEQPIPPTGYGTTRERAIMRSSFEPTILREPLSVWSISSDPHHVVDRVIAGLSHFLAVADVERLDQHLFQQSTGFGAPLRRHQSRCEAEMRNRGRSVDRVTFECRVPEFHDGTHDGDFSMEGVLYLKAGTVISGTIDRLSTDHDDQLIDLKITRGTLTSKGGQHSGRIEVTQRERRLHARLTDGHAISELTFQLGAAREERPTHHPTRLTGFATMTVVEDYHSIDRAIDAMVRETLAGELDVFARKPFRRASMMKALFGHLGMPPMTWCCEQTHHMPAMSMPDNHAMADHEVDRLPVLKAFHRYCAECHHEDLAFPPNFLHGATQQVQEQIQRCAERIFFRLEMWGLAPSARHEAPMPPITSLQRLRLSPEEWASHTDLALLKSYTAGLVGSQGGKPVRLEDLAMKGYDNLSACVQTTDGASR